MNAENPGSLPGTESTGSPSLSRVLLVAAIFSAVWVALNAHKPFHVDDTLFLTWSRAIAPPPGEAAADTINWRGFREPLANQTLHYPPGWPILVALARQILGEGEAALHLLQFPFMVSFLCGTCLLGSIFGASPWAVLLLAATSPLFLLPSASLMPDMACLGPGVLGIALWIRAGRLPGCLLAGALIVLGGQMKQTILPLLPLLFILPPGAPRPDFRKLMAGAGVVLLVGIYPRMGSDGAGGTLAEHVVWILGWAWNKEFLDAKLSYLLAVLSATALFPAGFAVAALARRAEAPHFGRAKAFAFGAFVAMILALWPFWRAKNVEEMEIIRHVPLGASAVWFRAALLAFLAWAYLALGRIWRSPGRWLLAWIGLVIAGKLLGTPFPAARFLVFLLPALAVLFVLDIQRRLGHRAFLWALAAAVAGNLWLGGGLARSDFRFARFCKESASRGAAFAKSLGRPLYTTGHWGLQFYVELSGGAVVDRMRDSLPEGGIILVPDRTDASPLPERLAGRVRDRWVWRAASPGRLAAVQTLPPRVFPASFHGGHVWLPYGFSREPVEEIALLAIP